MIGHFQTLGVKNLQWAGNTLPQGEEKQETDCGNGIWDTLFLN